MMDKLKIDSSLTILEGFEQMDAVAHKLLLLYTGGKFITLLSIGDLQRALLTGGNTNSAIRDIKIATKRLAYDYESKDEVQNKLEKLRAEYIPVVNDKNEIVRIVYWPEDEIVINNTVLADVPVVIMAGGQGTRLKPITNVIPKPLIPIGEKPIAHCIMDKFFNYGANRFLYSVNYKAELIENYFNTEIHPFNLEYYNEDKPLGTAGSLSLMRHKLNSTFFISNCDIIIEDDYENIYNYHKENKNKITIIACLKSYSIPYGILTRTEEGLLNEMKEKPTSTYLINTGMYILEPEVLDFVPDNKFFHITELIQKVKNSGEKVGIFPVSEGSWKDIGEWPEYLKNYVNQ